MPADRRAPAVVGQAYRIVVADGEALSDAAEKMTDGAGSGRPPA